MSLFNQGLYWYQSLPRLREDRLQLLMRAYEKVVRKHQFLGEILKFEPPVLPNE